MIIHYLKKRSIFILIISIGIGCTGADINEPPVTASDTLNQFVRTAPYHYINLNSVNVKEIEVRENHILYNVNDVTSNQNAIIGQLTHVDAFSRHFYVYDMMANGIFQIDTDGRVDGPLTAEGRGPGEHSMVGNLKVNNSFVFATDGNNGRINRYMYDMNPVNPIDNYIISMSSNQIDLNDYRILTNNRLSVGYQPSAPEQGLIAIHPIENLSDTITTIMPRIIPVGYEPNIYNDTRFSINSTNLIAATYTLLPWIFLFDEENSLTETLILEYSVFDEMDILPMNISRPQQGGSTGSVMPFTYYKLLNNGDIFITLPTEFEQPSMNISGAPVLNNIPKDYELIHLSIGSNGRYDVKGKYRFVNRVGDTPLWVKGLIWSEESNSFYAYNDEILFQFEI